MENVTEFPNINQIKDEAVTWVVKIHGLTFGTGQPLPAEQARALRAWMSQSDLHRDYFLKTMATWDAMDILKDLAEVLPLSELNMSPAHRRASSASAAPWWQGLASQFKTRVWVLAGSAGGLAMLVLLGMLTLQHPSSFQTDIGEQARYTLADGSVLMLNTDSLVEVDYTNKQRKIHLKRGEANFEVAKNKGRPFVVHAGSGMVWALGTSFNVDHRGDRVGVVVSEGRVNVFSGVSLEAQSHRAAPGSPGPVGESIEWESPRLTVLLSGGEAAQYQDGIVSKEALPQDIMDKKLAWQAGALLFEGETLEEAMQEISRYTRRQLVIVDPAIRDTRVGGRFKTDNIDVLLNALAKSLKLKMVKGEGQQILFSADDEKK